MSPFAQSRAVLTGTPAPNSYVDLYNLYKFIWPAHNIIGFSIPQLANMGKHENDSRVDELITRIAPFYIRIKKSDLGLPKPIFLPPDIVEMSPIQETIYDAIARMTVGRLEDGVYNAASRLSAIIRLRQAATNPNLLNRGLDDYYDECDESIPHIVLDNNLNVSDEIMALISKKQIYQSIGIESTAKQRGRTDDRTEGAFALSRLRIGPLFPFSVKFGSRRLHGLFPSGKLFCYCYQNLTYDI